MILSYPTTRKGKAMIKLIYFTEIIIVMMGMVSSVGYGLFRGMLGDGFTAMAVIGGAVTIGVMTMKALTGFVSVPNYTMDEDVKWRMARAKANKQRKYQPSN